MLAPEYETGLRIYGLQVSVSAEKTAVWALLGPHIAAVALELVRDFARTMPALASTLSREEGEVVGSIVAGTHNLFTQPYDAAWLADIIARIRLEQRCGLDIRARSAINRRLLSDFGTILLKRHRFSAKRYARLMDVATCVLVHDAAMAANFYYTEKLRDARATNKDQTEALAVFELATKDVRQAVSAGARSLRETSKSLQDTSDVAGREAERATLSSRATSDAVQTAANATDDLVVAIEDLEREAARSASQAGEAVRRMDRSNETIRSLSAAVDRIGSVVDVIADVANQTNLLALNATIEAARAGELGRGFSVVAVEVKTLSTQTSTATAQIGALIATVQALTKEAVTEMDGAGVQIEALASVSRRLAEAVHLQIASSENIARSAGVTATNATTTAESLATVSESVDRTRRTAGSILDLSRDLAGQTQSLDTAVEALFVATSKRDRSVAPLPNILAVSRAG